MYLHELTIAPKTAKSMNNLIITLLALHSPCLSIIQWPQHYPDVIAFCWRWSNHTINVTWLLRNVIIIMQIIIILYIIIPDPISYSISPSPPTLHLQTYPSGSCFGGSGSLIHVGSAPWSNRGIAHDSALWEAVCVGITGLCVGHNIRVKGLHSWCDKQVLH